MIGYDELRKEQAEKRQQGELMGIGISSFTEIVGAGPSKHFDILGHQDVRLVRDPHPPDRQGDRALRHQVAGPGARDDLRADRRRGAGHPGRARAGRGGRHRHRALRPRHVRQPLDADGRRGGRDGGAQDPRQGEEDRRLPARGLARTTSSGRPGKFSVKGAPQKSKTIQEIAFAAYTNHPQGMEAGLEAVDYYDPPNLTFPFGSYICVVDIDRGTGEVKIRRFVAVDDCGNIINPMIVDGQIHGGLTMGMAPALLEEISYDENGNNQAGSFMDYLVPTAMETPRWETDKTVTPSPHHPFGAKGVGESATVGAPPAIVNAVVDALSHLGVRHIDIPITPEKVWKILKEKGVAE